MENEIIKEIRFLKVTYTIHEFICILLLIIYSIVYVNIYWLINSKSLMIMISFIIFSVLFLFLLIIHILFIYLRKTPKVLKFFILISLIGFSIVFINSLFCSIICCYNSTLFDEFYSDCPYNYKTENFPDTIRGYINKIKKVCKTRRCYNINNNTNIFLCNFNDMDKYPNLYSEIYEKRIYREIFYFSAYCENYTDFNYIKKDKYNKYDIGPFDICPSKSNIVYNYILTYLFILSNLFCGSILWIFEFCSYKTILFLLLNVNNNDMSLNETNNTSKINNDININNQEHNSQFNSTEIIIVDNKNNLNNNKIGENNNIKIENSKSENQLIDNINNNNIFKIMNQKHQINKNDEKK